MRIMYGEYEIESDRHGSYVIKLHGKLMKRVTALTDYPGKPKWGSRKLEAEAIEDGKRDIEAFTRSSAL
jgi:hypothetical protein